MKRLRSSNESLVSILHKTSFLSVLQNYIFFRFCGQQTSVSYIMCLNAPEKNNNVHNESETKREPEPETKVNEKRARYEDAVLQHVDVMKNRLSPIQSSPLSGGFCTSASEILVIVLITSCLNCGIFLFITFCKG